MFIWEKVFFSVLSSAAVCAIAFSLACRYCAWLRVVFVLLGVTQPSRTDHHGRCRRCHRHERASGEGRFLNRQLLTRLDLYRIGIFDVDALCTTMTEVRPGSVVHQFIGLTPSLDRRKMACATAQNGRLRDNGNPTSRRLHPCLYDRNALGRRLLDARDRAFFRFASAPFAR